MEQQNLPGTEEVVTPHEEPKDPPAPQEPPVSKELFDKYRNDAKAFQDQLKAVNAQLEDMKMQKLKSAKNWEEVAKIKEQEAVQAKADKERLEKAILDHQKSLSLRTAATKAGINPVSLDDLDLLDFPELQVETTSQGKILVHGADAAILRLKTLRPNWFLKNPSAVNSASPEVKSPVSGDIDLNGLMALEKEYKKSPYDIGKRRAYEEGIKKFNSKR